MLVVDSPYVPSEDRYDGRMPYPRVGRSGLRLPEISLGLWNNFGSDRPLDTQRAILRRAFDLGRHALRSGEQLRTGERGGRAQFRQDPARRPLPLPRRARHLDEGRIRHVGRPLRRLRLAQVPAQLARPVADADGPGLRRHLLLAPPRSRDADRGDHGRPRHGGPVRARAVRRHLELRPGADPGRGRRTGRRGRPAADPPAALQHVRPPHRERTLPRARRGRRRQHRVLAARPGHADRPVPERHPLRTRAPPRDAG